MGFIHRAVQAHIALNYGAETEFSILGGRADVIMDNAVWEIKHASVAPMVRIHQAQDQARRYVDGEKIVSLGSAGIFNGSFYIQCGTYSYHVEYTTPAQGAILYSVQEVQKYEGEYFGLYLPHKARKTNKALSPVRSYTGYKARSSAGGGSAGMASAGLLLLIAVCGLSNFAYSGVS